MKLPILLSLISAAASAAAFPKINLFFLIWISLIPLIFAVRNRPIKQAFFCGLLSGAVFYALILYWLVPMLKFNTGSVVQSLFFSLTLWIYLSLYWGIWTMLINIAQKRFASDFAIAIFAACAWTLCEYMRTYFLTGFPWALFGYSQYRFIEIGQIAEWTGVYGVSFLIVFCNWLFYSFLTRAKGRKYLAAAALLIIAVAIFGAVRLDAFKFYGDKIYKAVIVQPSIDQYKKWDTAYRDEIINGLKFYASQSAQKNADLILFPETAYPQIIRESSRNSAFITEISRISQTFGIFGALTEDDSGDYYNAVFSFSPNALSYEGIHKKNHLVPFGEYTPFRKTLEKFFEILTQMGDIEKGSDANIFEHKDMKIGALICSENFFPDIARRFVLNGANVLTNHTNDAWFFRTAAPYQHFSMNVFRAIETRKTVLISANSGISGAVEASGKIITESEIFEAGMMTVNFMPNNFKTFYVRFGDIFVLMCLAGFIVFGFQMIRRTV